MKREEALDQLVEGSMRHRLAAARALHDIATTSDAAALAMAARQERVPRIRSVLMDTLSRVGPGSQAVEGDGAAFAARETTAKALQDTARMVVHEVRKVLPSLMSAAQRESTDFEQGETREYIQRLDKLVDAIERLGTAASTPVITDFDLAALIKEISIDESHESGIDVDLAGPAPSLVFGDRGLLTLAISNAIRNAIESTREVAQHHDGWPAVVVTWERTDAEYWVAVLDRGIGLPAASHLAFEIGKTSKPKHDGIGLAIAKQAIDSLDGTIELKPREGGGVACQVSWPALGEWSL
jgi:signal transduction histidine kinase